MSENAGSNGGAPPSAGSRAGGSGGAPGTDTLLASLGGPESDGRSTHGSTRVAGAPTGAAPLAGLAPRFTVAQRALAFGASLTASFLVGLPVVLHHDGLLGAPRTSAAAAPPPAVPPATPPPATPPPTVAVVAAAAPPAAAPPAASAPAEAPARGGDTPLAMKPKPAVAAPAKTSPPKPAPPPAPTAPAPAPSPALQHGALLQ